MQPVIKLFLAVLLAHLVGDFPLQSSAMLQRKRQGLRGYLEHGGVHLVALSLSIALFVGWQRLTSFGFWIVVLLYTTVHLVIDRLQQGLLQIAKLADSAPLVVLDQVLHLGTMALLAWFLIRPTWAVVRSQLSWSEATGERALEAAVVYVVVVFAGGYLIRYLTRNLSAGIEKPGETAEQVANVGMYIGWLERFLVITAILVQSPSMVGLIVTGKSIARFPELKERFAEYYLIGTLLSIALAVLGGLVLVKLWRGTISLK